MMMSAVMALMVNHTTDNLLPFIGSACVTQRDIDFVDLGVKTITLRSR